MNTQKASVYINHLKATLSRLLNALMILSSASLLLIAFILPMYYLADLNSLFLNVPFFLLMGAVMIYLAAGYLKSTIKRALFTTGLILATLLLPLSLLSAGQRNFFTYSALIWLLVSSILITLAAVTRPLQNALTQRNDI